MSKMSLKKSKYSLYFLAGVSVFLFVILGGISYAFLSQVLKGTKESEVVAGTLAIEYKDKKTISLDNIYPMSDEKGMMMESYQFSVENTGDVKALYDISLEEDKSTMNHSYLKYSLKRNNEEWSEPKVLDSLKLREQIELEVGSKDSYELKMWMDEKVGNEGQNKVFKARVVISSVQSNASSKDVTPPVIKLKGSLSESMEQNREYVDAGVESIVDDKDTLNKEDIKVTYEYYDGENTKEVENIDTSKLGVYYITYTISDKSGNIGKIIRSVNIYKKNTTPPVIRLNGNNLIAIKRGEEYEELGASASSGEKDLTSRVVTVGKVNTNKSGNYEIKYLITDNDGNTASIVRIVNIIHITSEIKADITLDLTTKPTDKIKLEGENLGDITYTSSDPDIVTVDSDGNVEGINPGTVTITITTSTGHKETIIITVTKTVNITYEKSTGISSISKTSDTCTITEKNGSCRINLPTINGLNGYVVSGWYDGETKVGNANDSITVTESKTYTAKATVKTYTIVYHSNGGNGEMSSQTVKAGESVGIKANSFTKEGYTFAGWTTNSNGTDDGYKWTGFNGVWNFDNGDKGITENKLNLYARWNINQYNVTYDYATNGGSSATKTSAKVGYNSAIDLTPSATKSGWTFVGWNTNKDAHDALKSLNMGMSNVTLYAIFRKEAIIRTVNFDANGNTINATSKSCTIPAVYNNATQEANCSVTTPTITAPSNTPRVIGYNKNASATSSQVGSNANLVVTSEINGEKYFAITTKDAIKRNITYTKQGTGVTAIGKTNDSCTINATYNGASQGTTCTVTAPSITVSSGYTAVGWNTSSTATNGTAANGVITLDRDQEYYSISYKNAITRTVTYTKGTGVSAIGKTSDSCTIPAVYNNATQETSCTIIALPSITASKGYTVDGWYQDTTKVTTTSINLSSNIELTAKATANTYTISYNSNGGSGSMASTTATTGKSVSISGNSFTKEGYTFAGWTTNSNGTDDGYNWTNWSGTWNYDNGQYGITSNKLTLYARWSINSYDVTYNYSNNGGSSATKTSAKVNYNSAIDLTPTATKSGWTFVGWNTNKDATSALSSLTMKTSNVTLYAIFRKEAITYSVNFNANGNTISATKASCTIPAVYNNATQGTSCDITNTPVITAPANTPKVIGYNQSASATSSQVGSNAKLTVNSSNNGKTYYAITTKDAITRTISYVISDDEEINSRVAFIGQERDSCTIGATYNGTAQSSSCDVITPTITSPNGYTTKYFSTTKNATSGIAESTTIQLTSNSLYYAIARDTTKPIWSLVSTNPASGTLGTQDTLTITFKGTDASGSLVSGLTEDAITILVNGTETTPSTKRLTSPLNVTNGKQYGLSISGIEKEGIVTIKIKEGLLIDDSKNKSIETTLTTRVTAFKSSSYAIITKANSNSFTDGATVTQQLQPFTVEHVAGTQQSGWTSSQLKDYRYMGANPNNYVSFNGEIWRIIGVFTVEDENGTKKQRLKIIRNASIGNYSWDNIDAKGRNDWKESVLQQVLNSWNYYGRTKGACPYGGSGATTSCDFTSSGLTETAKNMIGKVKWYLGGSDSYQVSTGDFYVKERSTSVYSGRPTSWIGKVGFMYPSDYGYAAGTKSCHNAQIHVYSSSCKDVDWLHTGAYQWTITPNKNNSDTLFVVASTGTVGNASAFYTGSSVRPVVFLKYETSITGGNGTSTSPYTLKVV